MSHTHGFLCPERAEHATPVYDAAAFHAGFAPRPDTGRHADTSHVGLIVAEARDELDQVRTILGRPETYVGRHSDQLAVRVAALPASKHWPVKA